MKITELGLGIKGISWEQKRDERGTFTRVWDSDILTEFKSINQVSIVTNPIKGTLRGLHFQLSPSEESKVVSCIKGSLFDVMVQVQPDSVDFGKMCCATISANQGVNALIIPKGFAHGYLTLEQNTQLLYFMDSPFSEEQSRGIHWMRNNLNIPWPSEINIISERDENNLTWDDYFG
ncbi:MAG: dTDP-4-dehydrorhamnose 3,5-epimerase family protein [Proteobacteria bacterium]|nr:dTDP-4-dehydrorhamnose 3,5-epimerase family protein [Pseudomonadota bacterium]